MYPSRSSLLENRVFYALLAFVLCGMTACDVLEAEKVSESENVQLRGDAIYITPGSSGIIDLKSLVTSGGDVRIAVSSEPRFGSLEPLGNELLRYVPDPGVEEARDAFNISLYGAANNFLRLDSVILILTTDTLDIPCALTARNDYVHDVTGPVIIDVLANDTACAVDISVTQVSLPDIFVNGTLAPKAEFGDVEVLNDGKIRYTPGPHFTNQDQFIYRITKAAGVPNAGDPEEISVAYVFLQKSVPSCADSLVALIDEYHFGIDTLSHVDSVYLDVTANDYFCRQSGDFSVTLVEEPQFGTATYSWNYGFDYKFPANVAAGFEDHFVYRICQGQRCNDAEVYIQVE